MTLAPSSLAAAARLRPSSTRLLARVLETPDLPERVAALEPAALAGLLERVGLEDAGEIVAFATTDQLEHVFDEDLWKNERPGEEERFDGARFALWLEILLESGEAAVARRLAELPEDLVTLAFHDQILVLRLDELFARMSEIGQVDEYELEAVEKALANCLSEELDDFQLVARQGRTEGWDALVAALLALDREHHDLVARILERCARLASGRIEDEGGLYQVLTESESLEDDVAGAREDRRAEAGHVAPTSAAAFLAEARKPIDPARAARDPTTATYFRRLAPRAAPTPARGPSAPAAWMRLVSEPTARLGSGDSGTNAAVEPLLARSLRVLAEREPAAFAARSEELAYLANVLAAGASFEGGRLRPALATRAAIAYVGLGLELTLKGTAADPVATLGQTPADVLFRVAYAAFAARGITADCPTIDGAFVATKAELARLTTTSPPRPRRRRHGSRASS